MMMDFGKEVLEHFMKSAFKPLGNGKWYNDEMYSEAIEKYNSEIKISGNVSGDQG